MRVAHSTFPAQVTSFVMAPFAAVLATIASPFGTLSFVMEAAGAGIVPIHEIHRATAGVVAAAVTGPMPTVSIRHIEVGRRLRGSHRAHHHRRGHVHRWRRAIANDDLSIDSGGDRSPK